MQMDGKVAIVMGGASGIGAACAETLARIRTPPGIEHGDDVAGHHRLASPANLQAAAQPGLDQRSSVMHLAHRVIESDQPGLRPRANGAVSGSTGKASTPCMPLPDGLIGIMSAGP
jgi:NAD(P)-dependent dehydrogenase (short-subunit alcohol dehydrogenase family)